MESRNSAGLSGAPHPPERQTMSVGVALKAARIARQIALDQIARDTHISLRHLQNLEADRFQDLPGGMYNRAFLRSYCHYLGMEADEYLERYDRECTHSHEKAARRKMPSGEIQSRSLRISPIMIWSLMLLGSIAGLYFSRGWIAAVFSPYFARSPAASLAIPQSEASAAGAPRLESNAPVAREPAPSAEPANTLDLSAAQADESVLTAIRLRLHAVQECWIYVSSDGTRVAERTLFPGDILSLRAYKRFDVILGNAGGIGLEINGKPAKPLGRSGAVVRLEITPQSIANLLEKGLG